jgi:hypothetical protein
MARKYKRTKYVEFGGGTAIEASLLELSTKSAQSVGRYALRIVAREMQKLAKAKVRKKTGLLAKNIIVKVDRGRDRSKLFASVQVKRNVPNRPRKTKRQSTVKGRKGPARYATQIGSSPEVYGAILEFGAPGHGMPPYPFMRTTWEELGGIRAVREVGRMLGEGLEREALRIAKGNGSRLRGIGYGGKGR